MAENSQGIAKKRRGPGRPFQKGQVANPGGRPKLPEEYKEAVRGTTIANVLALEKLRDTAIDEGIRLRAAQDLLNRAWGPPTQTLDVNQTNTNQTAVIVVPDNGRTPK